MAKKDIKLYLAILNHGWLRREMAADIIPMMEKTPGVELLWENPAKTWDHPISSNRNKITRRFLKTDCEYLLMIDDDVVPMSNPAELVFADKDIIGMPAKVRQLGRSINWVAYVKYKGGYAPVDFQQVDNDVDLLKVDAIGTGCIMIKRHVLESIQAPFNCLYDDDGVCTMGTDFAFCQRAGEAGFEIYTTPQRLCEHYKEVGLADISSWDDSDDRMELNIDWSFSGFEITQGDWLFLKNIIEKHNIQRVLEFGAGLSSLLMDEMGVQVISYETDRDYAKKVLEKSNGNLTIKIWDGNDEFEHAVFDKCDLVFVDGPMSAAAGGPGRETSIKLASLISDRVIIHDAGRLEETHWQNKYLKPHFKLISKSGHHETRCQYWERRI